MALVLAHRGASGYAPENTLEAFRLAVEQGADGFELDVHFSRDGHLVVIHDETVDRTTNGTGFVRDMTLAELQALDASNGKQGYPNARIPTLEEVFRLIQGTKTIVNVEIKTDEYFYPGIEEKVLNLSREMGVMDQTVFSSFNHFSLLKLRELAPEAKLGMLFADVMVCPWEYAKTLDVQYLHPMKMNIYTPDFSRGAQEAGYGINLWTVDDEETMRRCLAENVGIITNKPDIAVSLRNSR